MGRVLLTIGNDNLFARLDTITSPSVDIVSLRPLPYYARPGTSLITGFVVVTDGEGNNVPEVMSTEIMGVSSAGSFAYGPTGVVQLAFEKGLFLTAEDAMQALASYTLSFEIQDTATYAPNAYDVKFYDRLTGAKTFDSVVIGDDQLLGLMRSHISVADLKNMNPFRLEIFPEIRV